MCIKNKENLMELIDLKNTWKNGPYCGGGVYFSLLHRQAIPIWPITCTWSHLCQFSELLSEKDFSWRRLEFGIKREQGK